MDDIRTQIGKAILKAFEEDYQRFGHDANYDPDTCYRAADHVIALMASKLFDVDVVAMHNPKIIGPARFAMKNADGTVLVPVSDNVL